MATIEERLADVERRLSRIEDRLADRKAVLDQLEERRQRRPPPAPGLDPRVRKALRELIDRPQADREDR